MLFKDERDLRVVVLRPGVKAPLLHNFFVGLYSYHFTGNCSSEQVEGTSSLGDNLGRSLCVGTYSAGVNTWYSKTNLLSSVNVSKRGGGGTSKIMVWLRVMVEVEPDDLAAGEPVEAACFKTTGLSSANTLFTSTGD